MIARAAGVDEELAALWPQLAGEWTERAERALEAAVRGAIALEEYDRDLAAGRAALADARAESRAGRHREASRAAESAHSAFARAASVRPAFDARDRAQQLLTEIDAHRIQIGALRNYEIAANEAWKDARWGEAAEAYRTVVDGVEDVLERAQPVIARLATLDATRQSWQDAAPEADFANAEDLRQTAWAQTRAQQFEAALETAARAEADYEQGGARILEERRAELVAGARERLEEALQKTGSAPAGLVERRTSAKARLDALASRDCKDVRSRCVSLVRELGELERELSSLSQGVDEAVHDARRFLAEGDVEPPAEIGALDEQGNQLALMGNEVSDWKRTLQRRIPPDRPPRRPPEPEPQVSAKGCGDTIVVQKQRVQHLVRYWNQAWSEGDARLLQRVQTFRSDRERQATQRELEATKTTRELIILETNKLAGTETWECVAQVTEFERTWYGAKRALGTREFRLKAGPVNGACRVTSIAER